VASTRSALLEPWALYPLLFVVAGAALEADKLYTVAVNDFILGGGDGYGALGGGRLITGGGAGALVANDVMAYVEKLGKVAPAVEGRIKILGQ
jgi:2',3'-cyclic-nucleotide 2'-phosphodiesterase (5'-nucleotidase family)